MTITILGPDGTPAGVGERGDIAIRSPFACLGYLGADGPRRLADGSVVTGDIGLLDADGFVHLDGRRSEMIKSGGENVFPAEVEAVLLGHPAVADAAVVGVPDPVWGEAVRAVVVLEPGAAARPGDLMAYCRGRLAGYKVPKGVTFVEALR